MKNTSTIKKNIALSENNMTSAFEVSISYR